MKKIKLFYANLYDKPYLNELENEVNDYLQQLNSEGVSDKDIKITFVTHTINRPVPYLDLYGQAFVMVEHIEK